jgi:hypothetical protein
VKVEDVSLRLTEQYSELFIGYKELFLSFIKKLNIPCPDDIPSINWLSSTKTIRFFLRRHLLYLTGNHIEKTINF